MFEKIAYAAASNGGGAAPAANPIVSFFPLILIFIVFYFLLIRPQQKRQKALQTMVAALKKGDRVVTIGGILGEIQSIQNDYVVIVAGDNTKMEVLKSAISGLREKK